MTSRRQVTFSLRWLRERNSCAAWIGGLSGLAVFLMALAGAMAQQPASPAAHILFLKQDVSQYNLVFEQARKVIKAANPAVVVDFYDVPRDGPPVVPPATGKPYGKIVSIGTPAFEAAVKLFPGKEHFYSMIVALDQDLLGKMSEAHRKRIKGASILAGPSSYVSYAGKIQADMKAIGLLYGSNDLDGFVAGLKREAKKAGVELIVEKVKRRQDLVMSFNRVVEASPDTFFILPDFTLYDLKAIEHVILNTFKRGIPCIGPSESFVKSGALWAFTIEPARVGRQIAEMLSGSRPIASGNEVQFYEPSSVALNVIVMENLDLNVPFRIRKDAKLIDPRRDHEE